MARAQKLVNALWKVDQVKDVREMRKLAAVPGVR